MGFLLKFACAFIVFLTIVYYLVFGLLITSMGIYIKEVLHTIEPYVNQQEYVYSPTIFITLGVVILLIGLTGICALITKRFYVCLLFTTFLTLIFVSEISLYLTVYIMIDEIKSFFLNDWSSSISMYNVSADMNLLWDMVQMGCKCCGIRNSTDWKIVEAVTPIPKSCYHQYNHLKVYEIGCVEGFCNFFKEHSNDLANVGVTVMILQLVGIISSCSLTRIYRRRCKVL